MLFRSAAKLAPLPGGHGERPRETGSTPMAVSPADVRAIVDRACARPEVPGACAGRDFGAVISALSCGRRAMDVVTGWTGRTACALQAALRMSNEAFAAHLGIGVRTVADWHQKPDMRPRPETQQLLDTALARATPEVGERFAVLTGQPPPAASARRDDNGAAADAEHRLITDENVSGALGRLDQLAGWEPGTARRQVAARLAGLDRRDLLDRASRRRRIGRAASRMPWASTTVARRPRTAVTAHTAGTMAPRL